MGTRRVMNANAHALLLGALAVIVLLIFLRVFAVI